MGSDPEPIALDRFDDGQIQAFVAELYRTFLSRNPDDEGLAYYVERLKEGFSVARLIAVFANSDEHVELQRRSLIAELASSQRADAGAGLAPLSAFPEDYRPPGEAGRSYLRRLRSGFLDRYCSGALVLDVGFSGYDNPERRAALPGAIGVDTDFPGYDGLRLPFDAGTVDTVFSSHCLEHIQFDHAVIRDWYRVLKLGGFIVCMVPSQALYEKRRFLPSHFNADHKRMYTPSGLLRSFEDALDVNSYRVRHLAENDAGFNYALGPETHSDGAYEIELVIEKIAAPRWSLAE